MGLLVYDSLAACVSGILKASSARLDIRADVPRGFGDLGGIGERRARGVGSRAVRRGNPEPHVGGLDVLRGYDRVDRRETGFRRKYRLAFIAHESI